MTKHIHEDVVRDSIAANLDALETGLTLLAKEAYIPASIGTRGFIDILAKDTSGRYVLIEVKLTKQASRDTLHEVLKYIEGVKNHLALTETELRVMVAAVDWTELLLPFSSFVQRTTCSVQGFEISIDGTGQVVSTCNVEALPVSSGRMLSPWHELSFYKDAASLAKGIKTYEISLTAKKVDTYVLVVLDPPVGADAGAPSTKQITMGSVVASFGGVADTDLPAPALYNHALYFAMQQLTRDEYIDRLPDDESGQETLSYLDGMEEEEALCTLQEAVLDADPPPHHDFFEIGYAAKFHSRLIEEEGWRVKNIHRYGAFARNTQLTDETIISEISGEQGNSQQRLKMSFDPSNKTEVAEVSKRIDTCLRDNPSWRTQLQLVLKHLTASGESRTSHISVYNPSSGLTTVYLSHRDETGPLYVPSFSVQVPEGDADVLYYGALLPTNKKPDLGSIIKEFYEGQIGMLMSTLLSGGYEDRDAQIVRRMGLRYQTMMCRKSGNERSFYRLDDAEWEDSERIDPLEAYYKFFYENSAFTAEVMEMYASRWDGTVVMMHDGD